MLYLHTTTDPKLIGDTLRAVPKEVDKIFVIDDGSTDNQNEIIRKLQKKDKRIDLIIHDKPKGPGGALLLDTKNLLASFHDSYRRR